MPSMFTPQERDRLMLDNYERVRKIALRIVRRLPPNVDVNELIQDGFIGLIDAIERFDAERGVPFEVYAEIRIQGRIIDKLRNMDHVPRSVRKKSAELQRIRDRLRTRTGRDPSSSEMAAEMRISLVDYEAMVDDAQIFTMVSADTPTDDEHGTTILEQLSGDLADAGDVLMDAELNVRIKEAIESLPEKQRVVVTLYYLHGLSLLDIAGRLGVTESRACQLRGAAVDRLKARLKGLTLTPGDRRPPGGMVGATRPD